MIDTGIPLNNAKKVVTDLYLYCLIFNNASGYVIGVGGARDLGDAHIAVTFLTPSTYWPGFAGLYTSICDGIHGRHCVKRTDVELDDYRSKRFVLTMAIDYAHSKIVVTSDQNAVVLDSSTFNLDSDIDSSSVYNQLQNSDIYLGGPIQVYKTTIEQNDGSYVTLCPAGRLYTKDDGTRTWEYGLYSSKDKGLSTTAAVTPHTDFEFSEGTLLHDYTVLDHIIIDTNKVYGGSNEIPAIRNSDSKIGIYNLTSSSFSEETSAAAGPESKDVVRYEGITRATEPGQYKCKTVLSSLGKALGITLSDTTEHSWKITGKVNTPSLEKNQLTYNESVHKPTVKYIEDVDAGRMTIVDKNTNVETVGYKNVGSYSMRASINDKNIFAWDDTTQEDKYISGEGLFVNTSGVNLTIKGNGKHGVYYDSFAPIIASGTTLDGVDDDTVNITIENGAFDSAIGIFAYGKGNVIIKNGTFNVSQGVFVVPSIGIKTKFTINNIIANCDVGFLIEQSSLENKIDFQNGKVIYLLGWLSINTESALTPVQDTLIRNGKFGPKDGTTDIFDELDNHKAGGVSVTAISEGGYTYQIGTGVSPNPGSGSSHRRVIPNTGVN